MVKGEKKVPKGKKKVKKKCKKGGRGKKKVERVKREELRVKNKGQRGSNLNHAFCAQLLQPQQSRIQVTHAAYTTSRGHCPSSRRVRLTNHVECQPKFHHSTADLQSVSCTLRDRQRHNLLRRRISLQQMVTKVNPSTRRRAQSLQFASVTALISLGISSCGKLQLSTGASL